MSPEQDARGSISDELNLGNSAGDTVNGTGSNTPSPKSSPDTPATAHSFTAQDLLDDIWDTEEHTGEDVFGSGTMDRPSIMSDVNQLRTTHTTAGYREGLAAARTAAVQPGFDEGYLLGSALGIRAGWLLGIMDSIARAIDYANAPKSLEAIARQHAAQMGKELRIEELLSQAWIKEDGTWNWTADSDEGSESTIQAVASAHPAIRKWNGVVAAYCQKLNVTRSEPVDP